MGRFSREIRVALKLLLTLALLGFLAYRMDLAKFWSILASASWILVLVAGLVHLSALFPAVLRWATVLQSFHIETRTGILAQITLIGYFFNLFLPSAVGGDFFRAFYLSRRENRSMATTLATTAIDRVAGLAAMILIGLTASLFMPFRLGGYPLSLLFIVLGTLLAGGLLVVFHPSLHGWLSKLLLRFDLRSIEEKIELMTQGMQRLRKDRKRIVVVVALSILIQTMVVFSMWVAARAIGLNAPFHLFLLFIPIINLSVAIPVTINGVGLREGVYYLLFSQIGVAMENAVTLSLLNLLVLAFIALPGGVVYSLYKRDPKFPEVDLQAR